MKINDHDHVFPDAPAATTENVVVFHENSDEDEDEDVHDDVELMTII